MATPKTVSDESAFRVVVALGEQGGVGRFQDIERLTGTKTSTTQGYIRGSIERGWVTKTGPDRSIHSRYTLTADGRAELRKRKPTAVITVPLGSGPTGLAMSATDVVALASAREVASDVMVASLRQRTITALCSEKEWPTLISLLQEVRTGHRDTTSPRDLGAVLNSLNQQGLVTFVEGGYDNGHHSLTKIRATKRLLLQEGVDTTRREVRPPGASHTGEAPQRVGDRTDFRTHAPSAEGGPITRARVIPAEVVAPPADWPLLDALLTTHEHYVTEQRRASALIEAATALADLDPEESERLFGRAAEVASGASLTPLEVEYLRFAEAHR